MNSITVVIPTFNRRVRLQNAVESVLQENRIPIQLHIFDNASTDDTESYARSIADHDHRVLYHRNEVNIGANSNYSKAFKSVKSEYFVPLADDDLLLPDFLFEAFQILEGHKAVGAAIYVTEARSEDGVVQSTYPAELEKIQFGLLDPVQHLRDWMTYGHYAWSSILWRKATLDHVGFPFLHTDLPSDVDFQLQVFCKFPVYIVNKPAAVFSLHGEQASGTFNISQVVSWSKLFKRLDAAVERYGIFDPGEYGALKEIVLQRYRGAWSAAPAAPLGDKQLLLISALAGFRLNDWDLAFSLLDDVDRRSSGGNVGNLHTILRRLRGDRATIEQLQSVIHDLRASSDRLQSEVDELRRDRLEVDRLQARLDAVADEVTEIKNKGLLQALAKIGLLRFGP